MIARIKRPATIHDVAKRAGVAFKTVSRVLNNEANVTSATQEKVRKAIKALNYSPSLAARVLAGHRSFLIGLLYDTPSSYYIHSVQFGALERCRKAGFRILPGLKNLLQMRIVIDHMIEEPAAQYRGQYRPLSVLTSEEDLQPAFQLDERLCVFGAVIVYGGFPNRHMSYTATRQQVGSHDEIAHHGVFVTEVFYRSEVEGI